MPITMSKVDPECKLCNIFIFGMAYSRLTDQLIHYSLGKKCPSGFWHLLGWLTIPSDVIYIRTVGDLGSHFKA